jgi:hypothetical protein
MNVVKRVALVVFGVTVAGIALAGSASAAPSTPAPEPVSTQSHVLSILCPAVFAVLVVGGGLFLILRHRVRVVTTSEVVPTPPGSGLTLTHSQRDYQVELEDEDKDGNVEKYRRPNRRRGT